MLGSANCERCGRPVVGSSAPPQPSQHAPGRPPSLSHLPPPPPPGPAASVHHPALAAARRPTANAPSGARGCFATFALLSLFILGAGVFAAVRAGTDVLDDDPAAVDVTLEATVDFPELPGGSGRFEGRRPVEAPPVGLDAPVPHTVADDTVAVHRLDATGPVTISVSGLDGFDPVVRVVGSGSTILGENDDGPGAGLDSLLSLDLTTTPVVDVWVTDFSGDLGRYVLLVQPGTSSP